MHSDFSMKVSLPQIFNILIYSLNQDVLENFFGTIITTSGLQGHHDSLQVKSKLRFFILG